MPRSDEAQAFFHAVYSAVQEIPHGKVTTYGHIAMLVGTRAQPSLTHPKPEVPNILQLKDLPFNHDNVPWQRVINSKGQISPRSQPGGSRSQADALQAEGVQVETNAMGEHSVDFSQYGWFPDLLPSEENDQGE
ncbi:MGMT family [Fusarium subglutinans]|uniref:MGMT family n=1 Tax=Gibberella subglutinans TaxID=42677 RepID=A0A8H5V894_GIBSU|nr:MGMT family [Fusarium subglutinans]KAF5611869.1 MGMT family [Fusarium subglutinans]